jgi:hypothetical protein
MIPSHDPLTTAFQDLSAANLAYLEYGSDKEFARIAKACAAHLKYDRECCFEPFIPFHQQYMPEALKLVCKHMGYGSIGDAMFLHMAKWYWCYSHGLRVYQNSIDILMSRDVPSAVTYMHRSTDSLLPIKELAFQNLAETAEQYLEFTNDFDDWLNKEVTAVREFSGPIIQWLYYENGIDPID